ncbi:hypothetical protein [Agrococcus sp. SGAir0287]|uniref:hypothetical protein n=1 Tax=Agrococcus sp. SGAir0287 TaxID=2070347 RepID=UPI0010CCD78D|nr:hypothetical protein [Agrococcus sp. SGAir0287]QCR18574.1 hypothetical protein C1N71_03180 [Agrococcus sp. SGAir0287]
MSPTAPTDALLDAARKMVEAADAAKPAPVADPGFDEPIQIHIRAPYVRFESGGRYYQPGEHVTITPERVTSEMWTDRDGNNTFTAQLDAGVRFRRGPWPSWEPVWVYGSDEWREARQAARADALKIADEDERGAALDALSERYGHRATNPTPSDYKTFYDRLYARRRDWETAHAHEQVASASTKAAK